MKNLQPDKIINEKITTWQSNKWKFTAWQNNEWKFTAWQIDYEQFTTWQIDHEQFTAWQIDHEQYEQFAAKNITKRILEWSDDWSKPKKFYFTFTLSLFKLLARVRMDLDAVFGLSTDCTWTSGAFGLLTEIICTHLLHTR